MRWSSIVPREMPYTRATRGGRDPVHFHVPNSIVDPSCLYAAGTERSFRTGTQNEAFGNQQICTKGRKPLDGRGLIGADLNPVGELVQAVARDTGTGLMQNRC